MKKYTAIFFVVFCLVLCSCSDNSKTDKPKEISHDDVEAVVDISPEFDDTTSIKNEVDIENFNTERSPLSGLPCTDEVKTFRPIAVMYNNIQVSLPQSEISKADVVYECDAEGGITRLMALFTDWESLGSIGSIRSARDYFVELSELHEAIFVHAGGSPLAYDKLINSNVAHIDGVNMNYLPKNTFYRDSDRIRNNGYEHSMMTNGAKLSVAVDELEYEKEYSDSFNSPYSFSENFVQLEGECASSVSLKHSGYVTVRFDYDKDTNTYLKYSYGSPHIDAAGGEQLSFTNVLVLFVGEKVIDSEGRLDIDLASGGSGYYFSGGQKIDISWSGVTGNSILLEFDGEELMLNPGKTHITLFNKNNKQNIKITK